MTATRFFTVKEASAAIAAKLDIADADDRAYAARCHEAALVDAIASNAIVYRDPVSRLPIRRDGIVGVLVARSCVVSDADLNTWLEAQGVGVQVRASTAVSDVASHAAAESRPVADSEPIEKVESTGSMPTSVELATALGPYLKMGRDREWLETRLKDADRYVRLKRYRTMTPEGKRLVARWEPGAVVLHLIESGDMTRERALAALADRYPQHACVLGKLPSADDKPQATWLSGLT